MKYPIGIAVLCLWATAAVGSPDFDGKIDPSVRLLQSRTDKALGVPVIAVLSEKASLAPAGAIVARADKGRFIYSALTATALRSQRDLRQWLDSRRIKYQSFYIINAVAIEDASDALIREIASRADVRKIIGNPRLRSSLPIRRMSGSQPQSTMAGVAPNIVATGAPRAWADFKATGKGIIVAGQDTGVDWTHPALIRAYRGTAATPGTANHSYSWHDAIHSPIANGVNRCGLNTSVPCDDDQHGSHTMGTVLGNDGKGRITGMAPDAQWIACRNMDQGAGQPSTYLECFEFFLAPYPAGGVPARDGRTDLAPHVMNNSWACPASEGCQGMEFGPALDALKRAGIMVVVSAGNEGPNCRTIQSQPATWTSLSFSVGAMDDRNGRIANFSSRGPSALDGGVGPDVAAPGVSVLSTVPGGGYDSQDWSGTSMAGPHVAGLVALMWSANPNLIGRIDETAALIRKSADPQTTIQNCGGVRGRTVPNNTYGYGNINAYRAVEAARAFR